MNTKKIKSLQKKIERIKKRLMSLGEIHPGSLSKQYNICGNPSCRCKDPVRPMKHGPYFQVSYTHKGKSTSIFIKKEMSSEAKTWLKNYRLFRELTDEWVNVSLQIAKLKREQIKR